jgi:hypothetical protein
MLTYLLISLERMEAVGAASSGFSPSWWAASEITDEQNLDLIRRYTQIFLNCGGKRSKVKPTYKGEEKGNPTQVQNAVSTME